MFHIGPEEPSRVTFWTTLGWGMQVIPPPYYCGGDLRMSSQNMREVRLTKLAVSVK